MEFQHSIVIHYWKFCRNLFPKSPSLYSLKQILYCLHLPTFMKGAGPMPAFPLSCKLINSVVNGVVNYRFSSVTVKKKRPGLRSAWALLIPPRCMSAFWWGHCGLIGRDIDVNVLQPPINRLSPLNPERFPEFLSRSDLGQVWKLAGNK